MAALAMPKPFGRMHNRLLNFLNTDFYENIKFLWMGGTSRQNAFFSFLFFSFLFFYERVEAQCNTGPTLRACVVQTATPSIPCSPPGCTRFYYELSLVPQPTTPANWTISQMSFALNLGVSGPNGPHFFSRFNVQATQSCFQEPPTCNVGFPQLTNNFSIDENSFSLSLLPRSQAEGGPYCFQFTNGLPIKLFTLVVDAFPGETIGLPFPPNFGNYMPVNATSPCNLIGSLCQTGNTNNQISWPQPSTCSNQSVSFGNSTNNNNNTVSVPVQVSVPANATTLYGFDLVTRVTSTYPILPPAISSGAINASNVQVIDDGANGTSFTLYAKASSVALAGGVQDLFRVTLKAVNQSLADVVKIGFINGRIANAYDNCCTPTFGAPLQVPLNPNGAAMCNDYHFKFKKDNSFVGGNCQIKMTVHFSNSTGFGNSSLHELLLDFNVQLSGGATLVSVTNNWGCPSGTSFCNPGVPGCLEWTSDGHVRYCFKVAGTYIVQREVAGLELVFNVPNGLVNGVTINEAMVRPFQGSLCVPFSTMPPFPIMPPIIQGKIEKCIPGGGYADLFVSNVTLSVTGSNNLNCGSFVSSCTNNYSQCTCSGSALTLTPTKNDGILNGVSTFDLVLISRHILETELLDSPYKIIAADANRSGSVTTFDLVEIRKLILFIEESFSNNSSWRFVDAAYTFPNPANPFAATFPENISNFSTPKLDANFIGIKVGDVNCSAAGCNGFTNGPSNESRSSEKGVFNAAISNASAKKGEYVTIPFRIGGDGKYIAYQLGLRFDPRLLRWVGPSKGDIDGYTKDNFGLTQLEEGLVRTLWFSPDGQQVLKGTETLFNLTFQVMDDIADWSVAVGLDDKVLENIAFNADGLATQMSLNFVNKSEDSGNLASSTLDASCAPNPFNHAITFDVNANSKTPKASLWVFDAFGKRVLYKEVELEPGQNRFTIEEAASFPAGIYSWKVWTPNGSVKGYIIKQ
jgi:hypothetical protein